jgi:tetratricopeptide (TPR) repeat protein
MLNAGIPIEPVAGIALGLITDHNDPKKFQVITDMQATEDFYGEMDFKVAGTVNGITGIQMDTKLHGLTFDIIKEALRQGKQARESILDKMREVMPKANELSKYAPKIEITHIQPDQIGMLIGPGGKNIKEMFSKDIEELFNKKQYETISDIYSLLEGQALELFFSPDELEDGYTFFDRRFEVAYSLNEAKRTDEAQKVYESIDDPSSSVLNNLALIYERQGDMKKAKETITKSFKLTDGSNKLINRNKERMFSVKKNDVAKKTKAEPIQKPKLKWSDIEIKFTDENNIEILTNGKLKNKGDYETFGFKKADNISWEILRTLSYTKAKVQVNKEFYLTPENMFSKDAFSRSKDKKNLFQTYKSSLSKALCDYFDISDEPIPYDKAVMGYVPLLKITPEKELRNLEIQDTHSTQYLTDI